MKNIFKKIFAPLLIAFLAFSSVGHAAFTVFQGGTGRSTLTTDNLLAGNGGSPVQLVTLGAGLDLTGGVLSVPAVSPYTIQNTNSIFSTGLSGTGAGSVAVEAFFTGTDAGNNATNADNAAFIGAGAGRDATEANNSTFIGQNAGSGATNASNSFFAGQLAGENAFDANNSNFIGQNAGHEANSANNSNFFGQNTGNDATNASTSNFFGQDAGNGATNAIESNFFGLGAGQGATDVSDANFIGTFSGSGATNAVYGNFMGIYSGENAINASYSNFIGYFAGRNAPNASNSIFIGTSAGNGDSVDNVSGNTSSILLGNFTNTGTFTDSVLIGNGTNGSPISNTANNQMMFGDNLVNWRIAGVEYVMPSSLGSAGSTLTDLAGDGTLSWESNGSGTVTDFVFTDGSGFDGTVSSSTTTPTLSLTTSLTTGSVPIIGSAGALIEDNPNLFFNDSTNRFGIGTNTPSAALSVVAAGTGAIPVIYGSVDPGAGISNAAQFEMRNTNATSNKVQFIIGGGAPGGSYGRTWSIGSDVNGAGVNDFYLYSGGVNATRFYIDTSGRVGIRTVTPTANLDLPAGSATAGTAPLKINSGTVLGTTEAGAIENDGTHLYYTAANAGTRFQLDQQSGSGGTVTSISAGTGITLSTNPIVATGSVTSNLSTGIAGSQSVIGGTASGENLTLSSTANATKGSLIFGTSSYNEANNTLGVGAVGGTTHKMTIADTVLAGSGSLAGSGLSMTQTWNTTGAPTAIKLNVTNTASDAASLLMDLQVGGVSQFKVSKSGGIVALGQIQTTFSPGVSTVAMLGNGTWFTGGSGTTTRPYFLIEPTGTSGGTTWNTTGTAIGVNAASGSTATLLDLRTAGSSVFIISANGSISASGTATMGVIFASDIRTAAGNTFYWSTRSVMWSPSDGVIRFSNFAGSDFSRLQFGGTTSSFPSIKRNAAAINFRLADDSADAAITAAGITSSGNIIASGATSIIRLKGYTVATLPAGTVGDTAYVTNALTPVSLGAVVGGGAAVVPVFYDGTNWIVM